MAEIAQLHFALAEQHASHALALDDVVLPRLQADLIQRRMAECVVAQFKAVVEPHLESLDTLVNFARLIELLFVDETDDRNLLIAQSAQQLGRHRGDVSRGQAVGHAGGKIIDRDGNLAVRLLLGLRVRGPRDKGH